MGDVWKDRTAAVVDHVDEGVVAVAVLVAVVKGDQVTASGSLGRDGVNSGLLGGFDAGLSEGRGMLTILNVCGGGGQQ